MGLNQSLKKRTRERKRKKQTQVKKESAFIIEFYVYYYKVKRVQNATIIIYISSLKNQFLICKNINISIKTIDTILFGIDRFDLRYNTYRIFILLFIEQFFFFVLPLSFQLTCRSSCSERSTSQP